MYQENLPPEFRTWLGYAWRKREFFYHPLGYLAVWVGTGMIYTSEIPAYLSLILGICLIAAAFFTTIGEKFHQGIKLHLLATAAWTTVFSTWGSFEAAWSYDRLRHLTIALGLVWPIIGALTWHMARFAQIGYEYSRYAQWRLRQQTPAALNASVEVSRTPQQALWEDMFAAWHVNGIKFQGQRSTEDGNRIIRLRLPMNGSVTFDRVLDKAENVAIALSHMGQELKPGAVSIKRFVRSDGQLSSTDFVVILDLIDILSKIRWMPEDHTPLSITKAFPIGVYQDGRTLYMTLQEIHWAIVALTRAGKSNLLHVIIYQVSRCEDAVIWAIDMKGGSTFKPWLRPWMDQAIHPETGEPVRRPVIDWIATDKYEAERIMRAFVEIAADRPRRRFGTKTRVSRKRPHILLLCDEVSILTGTHANSGSRKGAHSSVFGGLFTEACAIGAGESCTIIYASQRNTVDYSLPGNAQANIKGRICLGAKNVQDARMVLENNPISAQAAAALVHPGSLLVAAGPEDDAYAARSFFMGDDDELDRRTYQAALLHGEIVPGIERDEYAYPITQKYGYDDRFEDPARIGWYSTTLMGTWHGKPLNVWDYDPDVQIPSELKRDIHKVADAFDKAKKFDDANQPGPVTPSPTTGFFDPPPLTKPAAAPKDPEQDLFEQIVGGEDLAGLAGSVAGLVAAMDSASADHSSPAPAAQPGDGDRVSVIVEIVDRAGPEGVMAADIITALIARGLLTEEGKTAVYRYIKQANDEKKWGDLTVEQPGGAKTRYYTRRHIRASRRAD